MGKKAISTDARLPSDGLESEILRSAGFEFIYLQPPCKTEEDLIRTCQDADVLMVDLMPITRAVMAALPKAKCVIRYGIGVNNVDLEAAKDLGVAVVNVPDFCTEEVSDHTLAMILSLGRKIPQTHQHILEGEWSLSKIRPIPAIRKLTLGLVSFGKIARRVAQKAKVFGLEVIAYDPFLPDAVFTDAEVARVDLATLFNRSDIISLHCPLIPETSYLINRDAIAQMKDGVILINTARGAVAKEDDLIEALQTNKISAAGLDVFEVEPLPDDSPLRGLNNVILTCHSASTSETSLLTLRTKVAEAARDFLQGKRPASALVWPGE
jgi:D-3-phosphoglycerate dehydrogenase / 2-oxoglutarate reductase